MLKLVSLRFEKKPTEFTGMGTAPLSTQAVVQLGEKQETWQLRLQNNNIWIVPSSSPAIKRILAAESFYSIRQTPAWKDFTVHVFKTLRAQIYDYGWMQWLKVKLEQADIPSELCDRKKFIAAKCPPKITILGRAKNKKTVTSVYFSPWGVASILSYKGKKYQLDHTRTFSSMKKLYSCLIHLWPKLHDIEQKSIAPHKEKEI
jgi:hypothetical protein